MGIDCSPMKLSWDSFFATSETRVPRGGEAERASLSNRATPNDCSPDVIACFFFPDETNKTKHTAQYNSLPIEWTGQRKQLKLLFTTKMVFPESV